MAFGFAGSLCDACTIVARTLIAALVCAVMGANAHAFGEPLYLPFISAYTLAATVR
jgi:hypothetical protein